MKITTEINGKPATIEADESRYYSIRSMEIDGVSVSYHDLTDAEQKEVDWAIKCAAEDAMTEPAMPGDDEYDVFHDR